MSSTSSSRPTSAKSRARAKQAEFLGRRTIWSEPYIKFPLKAFFLAVNYFFALWLFRLFHDVWQWDNYTIVVWGSMAVHSLVYWGWGLFLGLVDVLQAPGFLAKYKIQPHEQVGWAGHWRCFKMVAFNQVCIMLPFVMLLQPFMEWRGTRSDQGEPGFVRVVGVDLIVAILFEEVGFYYMHRMLHLPQFYQHVHKLHHSFTAPVAIAAEFAHPFEFLFGNVIPTLGGLALIGAHPVSIYFWTLIAIQSTLNGHSGYAFPFSPFGKAEVHDFHHSHYPFRTNYGAIGLLDWLHGTDKDWQAHLAKHGRTSEGKYF